MIRQKVILLTCGGLGNRLRPILGAMRVAEQTGRDLYIHWNPRQPISPLEDVAPRTPSHPDESVHVDFTGDWRDYFAHDIQRSNPAMCTGPEVTEFTDSVPRDTSGSLLIRQSYKFLGFDGEPRMEYVQHGHLNVVQEQIKAEMLGHIGRLQPAPHLLARIDAFAQDQRIDRDTIGLHIRQNHPSCGRLDLDAIHKSVVAALDIKRHSRCFLASDSPDVDEYLRSRLGNRIVNYPKRSRARDERTAVEDAVVDLFLLARTGHIIGSNWSTFSDIAWWLGSCRATKEWIGRPVVNLPAAVAQAQPAGGPDSGTLSAPNDANKQRLILCGGLQSGGTTIVSWCFLQRDDTDGVLDMRNDVFATSFADASAPILWVKVTVGAFRLAELYELYRDFGWKTQPLLIVRDVRTTYASLKTKKYGFNGTTAEDPPLMLRFLRFLEDWRVSRDRGWPILKFEDFLIDPRLELTSLCHELSVEWDEAMLSWPKTLSDIAYVGTPNQTFVDSIKLGSASAALFKDKSATSVEGLLPKEHDWLEQTFAEFNAYHGYPSHVPYSTGIPTADARPRFAGTRRQRTQEAIDRVNAIVNLDRASADTPNETESDTSQLMLKRLKDTREILSAVDGLDGLVE
jgi:hypothetical protein